MTSTKVVAGLAGFSLMLLVASFGLAIYWRDWALADWVPVIGFYLARTARNAAIKANEDLEEATQ